MNSRRLMCCPQSEDCTLPQRDRKYRVVHHSKNWPQRSEMGQHENPPHSGLCQLPPAADMPPRMLSAALVAQKEKARAPNTVVGARANLIFAAVRRSSTGTANTNPICGERSECPKRSLQRIETVGALASIAWPTLTNRWPRQPLTCRHLVPSGVTTRSARQRGPITGAAR
jgi:hypothetical protein